eukprot:TRINITY_DN8481_c0_g1_i17.p1 TRINITY_DN8481_c0_g1~~TRINITY_DN8481_c0_g1_i17.p1  ORF type:complete len:137 (+),score=12.10 TRINITY_DN8481_c0_g1_i17:100-510(+)
MGNKVRNSGQKMNKLVFTIVALALFALVSCEVEQNFAEHSLCCCEYLGNRCLRSSVVKSDGKCYCIAKSPLTGQKCCCEQEGNECGMWGYYTASGHCFCRPSLSFAERYQMIRRKASKEPRPVSYTHLTLPTIYSV